MVQDRPPSDFGQEAELGRGVDARRRALRPGEQVGAVLPGVVDEDAAQDARHAVGESGEEALVVDDGAQDLGDAPAHGDGPGREAPEDVGEELFGEEVHGMALLVSFCSIGIGVRVAAGRRR